MKHTHTADCQSLPHKYCSYCRTHTHNDAECRCTRPVGWKPSAAQAGSPTRPDGQVGSTIDPSLPPAPAAGSTIYAARDEHVDALRGPLDATQPNYDPVAAAAYAQEMGLPTEFDPAAESGEVSLPWRKRVLETGCLVPDAQTPKNLAALLDHQNKIIADLRRQLTEANVIIAHLSPSCAALLNRAETAEALASERAAQRDVQWEGRKKAEAALAAERAKPDAQTPKNLAALLDHQNKIIADLRRQITSPSYDSVHSNMVHYQAKSDDLQRQLENRSECEVCDRPLGRDDNCVCLACWNKVNAEFAGERAAKRLPSDLEAIVHSHLVDDRGDDRYPPDLCNFVAHLADQLAAERAAREAADRLAQWQPIKTAPKGKKVLAVYRNSFGLWRTITARYYIAESLESDDTESGFADEGWYEESDSNETLMRTDCEPTHWMPLPAAPEREEGKP